MEIIIILIAICIVAILTFSISYVNILSVDKVEHKNKYLNKILKNPGRYIIRVEMANTILGLLIGSMAVDVFALPIIIWLANYYGQSIFVLKWFAVVIIATIAAYITTILGSYIPKSLAFKTYSKNNKFMLYFFSVISIILWPITIIANIIDGLIKNKFKTNGNKEYLNTQIAAITNIEYGKGTIKKYQKELIDKTVKLNSTKIYDVYKKIDNVVSINIDSNLNDVIELFKKHEYSRIPVYENTETNIVGVIYIKDILYHIEELAVNKLSIKDIIRKPLYECKNILLSSMLRKMKESKIHIVVVKDEDVTLGILTFEDVLEEIVGGIKDEFEN